MKKRHKAQRIARRAHRILGPLIGIQFLFWTAGGVYFSWFAIDNVRGKYEQRRRRPPDLRRLAGVLPLPQILARSRLAHVRDIRIGTFLGRAVVRLYADADRVEMFDARTGARLSPISEAQARRVARQDFAPKDRIRRLWRVSRKGGEYKGPTPAYCVEFANDKSTRLYVHANTGRVTARRNSVWRGFDFLWMLHILDFQDRSDINNWLLRILSILGLLTIVSGYLLWGLTLRFRRRRRPPAAAG